MGLLKKNRGKIFDRVNEIAKKQPQEEASFCPSKEFREGLFRQCAAELGITILGEKDATIRGTIERVDAGEIDKGNAKAQQLLESSERHGVWRDEFDEDDEDDDDGDCCFD